MRNLTIALDDDLAGQARIRAAELDMSLSKYLARLLEKELAHANEYEAAFEAWQARPLVSLRESPDEPLPTREEIYDRPVLRRH